MPPREISVLFITTEPEDLVRPQTTRELEVIQAGLSPEFRIANVYRANRGTIMEGLDKHKPEVVHFLGHGRKEGLMIEDRDGIATLVTEAWLINVFARCPSVRLVVLNACRSAELAQALVESGQTTIRGAVAWSDIVDSDDVREFARIFHARIAGHKSVRNAFSWACDGSGERPAKQAVLALRRERDFYVGPGRPLGLKVGVAAALVGLVGVGVGAWFFDRQGEPDRPTTEPKVEPSRTPPATPPPTVPPVVAPSVDSKEPGTGTSAPQSSTETAAPTELIPEPPPDPRKPKRPVKDPTPKATEDLKDTTAGSTPKPPPEVPAPPACTTPPSALRDKMQALAQTVGLMDGTGEKFLVTFHPGATKPKVSPEYKSGESKAKKLYDQLMRLKPAELGDCPGKTIVVEFKIENTTVEFKK